MDVPETYILAQVPVSVSLAALDIIKRKGTKPSKCYTMYIYQHIYIYTAVFI
jgi:hypothetical protein